MNRCFSKKQMRDIIEGKCSYERIPMLYHFWCSPEIFGADSDRAKTILEQYPYDAEVCPINIPQVFSAPQDDPQYKWICLDKKQQEGVALDSVTAIEDWQELDDILANFPDPDYANLFPTAPSGKDRYVLAQWWYCFFERLWSLRGMENALTDFYLYPEEVHKLFDKLTEFYCRVIERAKEELGCDGIFTSDDIGTQTGPFFSMGIFREFFKPYYKRLIEKAHSLGVHVWLHSCGNIEPFIPEFIDIGLDVLHPIQKYTMDERDIANKFGQEFCIWAGFDMQRTIPYGTPDDVRKEVRYLIDTYANQNGRFLLTLGNHATADMKIESLEALLHESYHYGIQKMEDIHTANQ